jgi:hypothetical protein
MLVRMVLYTVKFMNSFSHKDSPGAIMTGLQLHVSPKLRGM